MGGLGLWVGVGVGDSNLQIGAIPPWG